MRVWGISKYAAVYRYVGEVLGRLGYHARVRVFPHPNDYFNYVLDSRHHAQVGHATWSTDVATSSTFFDPFSCEAFVRGSTDNGNLSQSATARWTRAPPPASPPTAQRRISAGAPSIAVCWRPPRWSRC